MFVGFQLAATDYQVDHTITDGISKFPTPTNRTDLRSFFPLVINFQLVQILFPCCLHQYSFYSAQRTEFQWSVTHGHGQAFQTIKESLTVFFFVLFFTVQCILIQ